ncbi:MAG: helix-turn-helix domain-containing protein [Verrucomicrobiota bacterium]
MERAVILCADGEDLQVAHLGLVAGRTPPAEVAGATAQAGTAPAGTGPSAELLSLGELEKRHILHALEHSAGNRTHAAKLLGISVRTLRNKLNEYGVAASATTVENNS